MKRPYKEGDWFRIPLDSACDAVGLIARACRSRLFGYFFAVPADATPSHDELRSLRLQDAATCALFGGAAIEDARWPLIATSLRFDREAWPFPQFASRGAFGRTWSLRVYDPQTMQTVATQPSSEADAAGLPDARFSNAQELETLLRERICSISPPQPIAVAEVRSPLIPASLHVIARGGRVQFSEQLEDADLEQIARFIAANPEVELRVHGFARFDARMLQRFESLRSLILEVDALLHAEALSSLVQLRTMRLGAMDEPLPPEALAHLPQLRTLELHGGATSVESLDSLPAIETLALVDAGRVRIAELPCSGNLRDLTLAHMPVVAGDLTAMRSLARLELRDLPLHELPDFSRTESLRAVALRGVRRLRDLRPLAAAPHLRELRIERMPQLSVADFEPLRRMQRLRRVFIDVGSRQKEREIYRLLRGSGR
jgi:hypothetical protein